MELWVATSNAGKLNEIRNFFMGTSVNVHSISELPVYTSPKESGKSFDENARIKAKALRAVKNNVWVLAEDSGLEVEGLNNMPGIHSARYAGENASDAENIAKLLKMMSLRSATHRAAQFRCSMMVIDPDGNESLFYGTLKGNISRVLRGNNGFGYDPIFIPEGCEKTLAEMSPAEKNKISHRIQALREFKQQQI
ncbi:MAG: RdgB/HAM1 family non-canonical purine NTP pyrophosphatase [Bdellovibrionaceae bacterium]|nr:RdgB/HAM1 family non-canonical purine NTP pyrophosphatase [Pseudobdellovibrionaceae bacterium]